MLDCLLGILLGLAYLGFNTITLFLQLILQFFQLLLQISAFEKEIMVLLGGRFNNCDDLCIIIQTAFKITRNSC